MRNFIRLTYSLLALTLVLAACAPETSTPVSTEPTVEPDMYLNIIWHQHQPFYAVDAETGLVSAPWVRFHAAKDYVDMVTIIENYPNIHMTVNLTPSLLSQIDAFNEGQRDIVWEMTFVPADELTNEQKAYIFQRFFDVNSKIIERFPRYLELQQMKSTVGGASQDWSDQDFRDLQVLFNLAWTDPDYLAEEPLASLVAKGRNFTEADKVIVLQMHADLMAQVIPVHKQYQDSGQIEVTFTPYAHPILPLLIDTNLATIAVPDIKLPSVRFTHGDDAIQHLERGMALYEEKFGQPPQGMWPAEGSVAQYMVGMTARAGVQWMVTDEGILANSLGLDFTRLVGGVPTNATALYRPYTVESSGDAVTIFFRDTTLSNKVSFDYSQISAAEAVADFMSRLHAIRDEVKDQPGGPYVVTVILDGENAWEWYENDGKDFLNGLYTELSNDPTIKTVTPSEFLALYDQTPELIPDLWAGSWDSATFQTWIGEDEENRAWDYLAETRSVLEEYLNGSLAGTLPDGQVEQAYEALLAAEGSDWFWWYGADKDSGNDAAFDAGFRETLGQVYDALGLERPTFLSVPIIQPTPVEPDVALQGTFTPTLDGEMTSRSEWMNAGAFLFDDDPSTLEFGFDKNYLYLNIIGTLQQDFDIYLKIPAQSTGNPFSESGQVLAFYATHRLVVRPQDAAKLVEFQVWDGLTWSAVSSANFAFSAGSGTLEIAVPIADLQPTLDAGDSLQVRLAAGADPSTGSGQSLLPANAPGRMQVPDLGRTTWVVTVSDPANDDHGPGTYTYPTDGVFKPGVFDLLNFQVGYDENNLVFRFEMRGPVENPWGSPNGLAIQLFDVYINTGAGANPLMRYGRNTSLETGWDYALTVAGWNFGFFTAADPEKAVSSVPVTIITDPGKNMVIAKVPLSALPGDPAAWSYAVAVLSNDGYGINGVRDVTEEGGQWQLGGAPSDKNHTRIVDYL
ncbi:MAG: glucodextranase DOMON-like domain-containing protein, partial [Chloroflexota bacterium]